MNREYQVLYRQTEEVVVLGHQLGQKSTERQPTGPVLTVHVIAAGPDVPRAQFQSAGFAVIAVNEIQPVVDWTKPNFDLDEAGAYCGMKGVTFSKNKGDGKTPWVSYGRGLVPRAWLDKFLLQHANEAGREIARQLAL